MYAFAKSIRKADRTRRYTIQLTGLGWEVCTEQDAEAARRVYYRKWRRAEHAQRAFVLELAALAEEGWKEIPAGT